MSNSCFVLSPTFHITFSALSEMSCKMTALTKERKNDIIFIINVKCSKGVHYIMEKKYTDLPEYSVLMSVYAGERPEFLRQSIESMMSQTYPTNDFVLVCDGELTDELENIVKEYEDEYECFHPLRIKKTIGTGQCANAGISACLNEYIVKMDSDDIALPQRCEISMRVLAKNPDIDMLGAYIDEFDSESGEYISTKKTPLSNSEIRKYAKRRNPFNNQTLVYKKSIAEKVGGYTNIKRCEDYEFVVKMLSHGARGRNLDKVLVRYRITANNYKRRKNWANTKSFINVRWRIYRMGFSDFIDFAVPCACQLVLFVP